MAENWGIINFCKYEGEGLRLRVFRRAIEYNFREKEGSRQKGCITAERKSGKRAAIMPIGTKRGKNAKGKNN